MHYKVIALRPIKALLLLLFPAFEGLQEYKICNHRMYATEVIQGEREQTIVDDFIRCF